MTGLEEIRQQSESNMQIKQQGAEFMRCAGVSVCVCVCLCYLLMRGKIDTSR